MIILISQPLKGCSPGTQPTENPTARDIVDTIRDNLTCTWADETVDTFKAGNPDDEVKGIATTFIPTVDVLKRAVALNCNLIITHEPTFYNHLDQVDQLKNDPVYQEKVQYIEDNGLIIFRFHDHWHRTSPDGIYTGMIDQLGWEQYRTSEKTYLFLLPESTAGKLTRELKDLFNGSPVRLIGDPDMTFTKVGLSLGAPGYMSHIRMLERDDVEVLIAGEVPEWESITYVRDAANLGKRKAMILIGHVNSEEAGMEYLANWLRDIQIKVPVHYVPAGDPFWIP